MIAKASDSRKLADYFASECEQKLMNELSTCRRNFYKRAVRMFLQFTRKSITIGEITPEALHKFDSWLNEPMRFAEPESPNTRWGRVDMLRSAIRKVLHRADPQRFKTMTIEREDRKRERHKRQKAELPPAPEGSLAHLFETGYRPKHLRGKSVRTAYMYHLTFKRFEEFLGRIPMLTDATDDQVEAFLLWRRTVGKVAARTANRERSQFMALVNFAARKGLAKYLDVVAETEPIYTPQAWTREQLAKLFAACKAERGWLEGVRACDWWTALHEILWNTGERIEAIYLLRWEHVNLETGWVNVPSIYRKFKKRDKAFKIGPETVAAIKAIQWPSREKIFPWPYCYTYLFTKYEGILERAGLPHGRESKFHRMRKSVASHLEAAGGNATAALDHSSRKITERYLDPTIVKRVQPVDLLFRPDAPTGGAT